MPGIPLLNLGTALGGLAGGWNQARSQGLQQALQQLMQQQYQDQSTGQALASLAAQAGLLNQPGQTPLQSLTGAVPNQTSTPTPSPMGGGPQVSPSSGMPMPQGYTYSPPGPMSPYGPPDDSSQDTPPDSGDLSKAGQVMHNPDVLAGWQRASGYDPATDPTHITLTHPGGSDATPTPTPLPTQIEKGSGVGDTAPAQSSDSGGGQQSGGGPQQAYGIPLGNGQVMPLSSFFQQTDYQKLAQGVARLAPPGTSQAAIYSAVVDLAKLSEGDRTQQQQAGLLLRAMYGGNLKLQEIGLANQGRANVAGIQAGSRQQVAQTQTQSRERVAGMQDATKRYIANQTAEIKRDAATAKNANDAARIAQRGQALATALQGAQRQDASLQIRARVDRINAIRAAAGSNDLNEDQQKQVQMLSDQIDSLANKAAADQGAGP